MRKTGTLVAVLIFMVLAFVAWEWRNSPLWGQLLGGAEPQTATSTSTVAPDPGGLSQVYESGSKKFSIRYPQGYTVSAGSSSVKFYIDPAIATGTNLATDSYIEVLEGAGTTICTVNEFFPDFPPATRLSEGVLTYLYSSTTGAAAGNRYEEQVFVLPKSNSCFAVHYLVHYGAIENYPAGAVQEFNRNALLRQFDAIRKTLRIAQ